MTRTVLVPGCPWPKFLIEPAPKSFKQGPGAGRQRALSPAQAAMVREARENGATYRTLEEEFKVSRRTLVQAAQRTGIYAA